MASYIYIGLNVGGKIYQTSQKTLTRDPDCFFTSMLSGSTKSVKDDQGNYLIDRDGEIFRHVLNFLRCEKLVLPEGFNELRLIECEAEFFKLGALKEQVQRLSDGATTSEKIGLNVGGMIYRTTRKTLTQYSESLFTDMLSGEVPMLSGEVPTHRDEHGNYLLDCDRSMFRHILNYLRHGRLILPENFTELGLLEAEANYFRLPTLTNSVKSMKKYGM